MTNEQREKILSFLQRNQFGVVATNSDHGAPESAVVAVSETEDLCVVFGSFNVTRKNQNIANDPMVSLVVGWDDFITLQIEGKAEAIEGEERTHLEAAHCLKNKASLAFKDDPRQEYFKVVPTWMRYSNYSVDPQEVWEVSFE